MTRLTLTASQTVGPFFHDCLMRDDARCDVLVVRHHRRTTHPYRGPRARRRRRRRPRRGARDLAGEPARSLQPSGRRARPPARSRRSPATAASPRRTTDSSASRRSSPAPSRSIGDGSQAPHIAVAVLGRGLLNHLYTRIYFDDEPLTADDPILQRVPTERRATLIARRDSSQSGARRHLSDRHRAPGRGRDRVLRARREMTEFLSLRDAIAGLRPRREHRRARGLHAPHPVRRGPRDHPPAASATSRSCA